MNSTNSNSHKYLIIAPAWVGDMVMAQSLFLYLKQLHPSCTIDLIAPSSSLAMADFMPEITEATLGDFKHGEFSLGNRHRFGKSLRDNGYTHSITLPNSWKSALIPYSAKIPNRIGWKGEMRYGLINDIRTLDKEKYPLMIERFDALAIRKNDPLPKTLPFPKFTIPRELSHHIQDKFKLRRRSDKASKIIAICPGAEFGPAKKWPARYYAEVATLLMNAGHTVWLFGGPGDIKTTDEILAHAAKDNITSFAGKTSLPEAVALLNKADAVLSNDSGLMHIACALDKKTFVIYGSTSDKFTPPLHAGAKIMYLEGLDCRPCFKRECPLGHMDCLNKLTPKKVIQAFNEYLSES